MPDPLGILSYLLIVLLPALMAMLGGDLYFSHALPAFRGFGLFLIAVAPVVYYQLTRETK